MWSSHSKFPLQVCNAKCTRLSVTVYQNRKAGASMRISESHGQLSLFRKQSFCPEMQKLLNSSWKMQCSSIKQPIDEVFRFKKLGMTSDWSVYLYPSRRNYRNICSSPSLSIPRKSPQSCTKTTRGKCQFVIHGLWLVNYRWQSDAWLVSDRDNLSWFSPLFHPDTQNIYHHD